MSSSSSGTVPKPGQVIGKYTLVRALGARSPHAFAAQAAAIAGDPDLVFLEVTGAGDAAKAAVDAYVRRARRLAQVRHPNVARIRDVVVAKDHVVVASDWVEGELLGTLLAADIAAPKKLGLVERLRILVDVLSGISALHLAPELAGANEKEGKPALHGALHPSTILVGLDGSARLVRLVRAPSSTREAARYTAPELLLGDETSGTRADLYSVGVMLWEALSEKSLFDDEDEKAILARQLAGEMPKATIPADAPWAAPLVEVAARALEVDPEKRFASAAELAGALRLAVQARLAPTARVASVVASLAKEGIDARRAALRPAKKGDKLAAKPQETKPAETKQSHTKPVESKKPVVAAEDKARHEAITAPDAQETTAKKPVPVVARAKPQLSRRPASKIPSLAADDEPDETMRLAVDSIADDDLFADDDVAEAAPAPPQKSLAPQQKSLAPTKKSMPPPLRAKSVAPPPAKGMPTIVAAVAPPPPALERAPVIVPEPAPSPSAPPIEPLPNVAVQSPGVPLQVQPMPALENAETVAPVVASSGESVAPAPAVAALDSKIEVIPPPADEPARKKRRAIVIGVIASAALLFLVGIVKHAVSGHDDAEPPTVTTTTSTHSTASASATPTTPPADTVAATGTSTPPPQPTSTGFVAEPVPARDDEPITTTSKVGASSNRPTTSQQATPHSTGATPPAKPRKRPPRSSYEPEGI